MGLKGGISNYADPGPPLMLRWYLSPTPNFFSDWLWPYCELMPHGHAYDGCLDFKIYLERKDSEPSKIMFVERWENLEIFNNYQEWRRETGVLKKLRSFLQEDPIIRIAEDTGI